MWKKECRAGRVLGPGGKNAYFRFFTAGGPLLKTSKWLKSSKNRAFLDFYCRREAPRLKKRRFSAIFQPEEPQIGGKKQHLLIFYRRNQHKEFGNRHKEACSRQKEV
ncbi:MAG: hypothetical protein IJL53_09220 [Firmicutes bacterium]|nr:hypothetical protein [Bacillota bacterium]